MSHDLQALADAAVKSGLAPKGMTTHAAFYIMAVGRDIGIPPTVALNTIKPIQGRPTMSAESMLALAVARGVTVQWGETTPKSATLTLRRNGHEPYTSSFTMDDAKRAGLSGGNWTKYPQAMLRARCISAAVRAFCPDVVTGLYTPEEVESFDAPPSLADDLDRAHLLEVAHNAIGNAPDSWGADEERVAKAILHGTADALECSVADLAGKRPADVQAAGEEVAAKAVYAESFEGRLEKLLTALGDKRAAAEEHVGSKAATWGEDEARRAATWLRANGGRGSK